MTLRTFDNIHNLHIKVIEKRFAPLDPDARLRPYDYTNVVTVGDPQVLRYLEVESIADTADILTLLSTPSTPEEDTYVTEFDDDRTNFRVKYQETVDALLAIENDDTMTNAEAIANIKLLAKDLRLLIRLLFKTRFSS